MDTVTDFAIGCHSGTPNSAISYWTGRPKARRNGWTVDINLAKIYKTYTTAERAINRHIQRGTYPNAVWEKAKYQTVDEWKAQDPFN